MTLKPSDRYLAELLGISDAEFEHFINEAQRLAAQSPRPSVTAGLDPFTQTLIINLVLTAGSMLLGSLFAPKAPGKPATITTRQQQGPDKTQNKRYVPTSGFDSFQEVAKLQTTVPVIYAKQEDIGGKRYGGIRVNGMLLWSQMFSFRDHQMFRGIFLLGEGRVGELDHQQFALGDTPLTSMNMPDSAGTTTGSRYTIYYRPDGGRILQSDYLTGRAAATDGGNAQLGGAADIYQVHSVGGAYRPDVCMTSTPSTTITFGVYGGIPNNLGYRVNPTLRPTWSVNLKSRGTGDGKQEYDLVDDNESLCSLWKSRWHWSPRSIITSGTTADGTTLTTGLHAMGVGSSITYTQYSKSDAKTRIVFQSGRASNSNNEVKATSTCADIAGAVAARQETADDTLILNALYRVGSCWAILESRTPSDVPFVSEASNDPVGGGNQISYLFRVVRAGYVDIPYLTSINPNVTGKEINPPSARLGGLKQNDWQALPDLDNTYDTATTTSQIYRLAVATFSIPRPCNVFELGIRSKLGIQVGGLCNFRDSKDMTKIDYAAVGGRDDDEPADPGDRTNSSLYQSGQVTRKETRYSFIRFAYRRNGDADFIVIPILFGISGDTSQDVFNYVRFEMPGIEQWEVRVDPISGWEIRYNIATGNLAIINAGLSGLHRVAIAGLTVVYSGLAPKGREQKDFKMTFFDADEDLGLNWTDTDGGKSMIDLWGKLAEMFVYDEIQASCSNGPEHTITYINTITPNPTPAPSYDHLAILGLNIRSSTELQQLPQFSARVVAGVNNTNSWPDALYDAATNDRYGTGDRMTPEQINKASFDYSAAWVKGRKYFYDALVESPVNLREWAAEMAPMFLLTFGEIGGQWYLTPAITFGPVQISALFTAGNIMEDTFRLKWLDADDRQPVRASATWREERYNLSVSSPGIFPVEQEVLVEEVGLPANAQTLSLPMNEFCTNKQHAIDACKLVVRYRRYTTHRITFETTYDIEHAAVRPDVYIRVEMDELFVSGWNNGVCAANGQVTSTTALSDGSYNVIAWNGNGNTAPVPATLGISGGIGNLPGYVFAVIENQPTVNTYLVERVAPLEDGRFTITAVYAPTNSAGVLLMAADWDSSSAWRISP